jgi:sensor histidine kinase YesM
VVSGTEDQGDLLLTVSDNGKGIAPERLESLGHQPVQSGNKGGGVALHQLLQCLRLVFGEQAALTIDSTIGTGTVALIKHIKRSG